MLGSVADKVKNTQRRVESLIQLSGSDELHELRDRVIESGKNSAREEAEGIAETGSAFEHYTDVAEALEAQGEKELEAAEEIEESLEEELEEFRNQFRELVGEEAQSGSLNDMWRTMGKAEGILEMAAKQEEELYSPVEDAKKFFKAVIQISETDPEKRVGRKKPGKGIKEAEKFEKRIKKKFEKIKHAEDLLDSKKQELKDSNRETVEKEEELVRKAAKEIINSI